MLELEILNYFACQNIHFTLYYNIDNMSKNTIKKKLNRASNSSSIPDPIIPQPNNALNPQPYDSYSAPSYPSGAYRNTPQVDYTTNSMPNPQYSQAYNQYTPDPYASNNYSYTTTEHANINYPQSYTNPTSQPNPFSTNTVYSENQSGYGNYTTNNSFNVNPSMPSLLNPSQGYNEYYNNPPHQNTYTNYNSELAGYSSINYNPEPLQPNPPPQLNPPLPPPLPPQLNPPPKPKPQMDYEQLKTSYLQDLPCSSCAKPEIELFLPDCNHPYHISCFEHYCKVCGAPKEIDQLKKRAASFCQICQNDNNLLNCETCGKIFCFLCLFQRIDEKSCCALVETQLQGLENLCPGCEYVMEYSKFIPIGCKGHALLCKKCLCLGMMAGKCVLGCRVKIDLKDIVNCQSCGNKEIGYRGDFECGQCSICYKCQWQENLKNGKNQKFNCVFCSDPLVPQVKVN